MLFFYVIAILAGTIHVQAIEGMVVCRTEEAADIIRRCITKADKEADKKADKLFLFDYDGVIGAGTGHQDSTPPRFNEQGEWQPRCPELLAVFKKLREENPENTYIYSSGSLFVTESMHYLGKAHTYYPSSQTGLLFYEGLGFWLCLESEHDKGHGIKGLIQFLQSQGILINQVVFIDDSIRHVAGVFAACQSLKIPSWCIFVPHEKVDQFRHSPHKIAENGRKYLPLIPAFCSKNRINMIRTKSDPSLPQTTH